MEKLKRSGWFWWMTIDSQGVAVLVDLFRAASLDKYKIDAAIFLLQELNGFEYIKFDSRFGAWLQIAVDRFQDNFTIFEDRRILGQEEILVCRHLIAFAIYDISIRCVFYVPKKGWSTMVLVFL